MKKFAVFDIDGTLYRWQLYHELVQLLALEDILPNDVYRELDARWNKWRGGEISFDDYEHFVVQSMVKNLPSIPVTTFENACVEIVKRSAHKTHHYPRQLLKTLKDQDYTIIAITGSQQELIDRFGRQYGFDIVVGAVYERDGNHFTGRIERPTIGKKAEILQALVADNDLSWQDSIAIGDSDGDAALLEVVERPIAFNPSTGLFERAQHEGWPIVIERKNIAYRLEKGEHGLVLAETITY